MLRSLLRNSWKYLVALGLGALIAWQVLPPKIETKTVTEVKERVRTVTRIKESPDGTKETIIEEKKETDFKQVEKSKPSNKDWSVGLYTSTSGVSLQAPIYTLRVDRRILLDLSIGAYVRTDKEIGLGLSWGF